MAGFARTHRNASLPRRGIGLYGLIFKLAENPSAQQHQHHQGDHAGENKKPHVGGATAGLAQAPGTSVFRAIDGLAVSAHAARQPLAFIARGRLVFGRLPWTPPTVMLVLHHWFDADAIGAWVPFGEPRVAARTVVALAMVRADKLAAVVTARDGFGLADVAIHSKW